MVVLIAPTTFEVQFIKLMVGAGFLVTNIYRPPSITIDVFFSRFVDLLDLMVNIKTRPGYK